MLLAGSRIGPYEIIDLIGAGGMGEVYRARDPRLNRDIALKVLPPDVAADPERIARFTREAQALAALNHPNIATIFGVERQDEVHGLAMELVEGPTLADRLTAGPLEWRQALTLAREIAEAMSAAHERGIIHRDLKPANIKLTATGSIKVLDFGLAKALDRPGREGVTHSPTISVMATGAGVLLGTAPYMSPEQARATATDRRSDVWAFGCILYELLTAKRAFAGATVSDTLAEVLRGEPDWTALPKDLPAPCVRLLERCLAKEWKARLADLHDASLELGDCLSRSDVDRSPVSPETRAGWRRLAPLTIGVGVGLLSAWLFPRGETAPQPLRMTVTMPPDVELPTSGGASLAFTFSPDGRALFFNAQKRGGLPEIYRWSLDAFGVEMFAGSAGFETPSMSLDGRSLFVVRNRQIFRLPLDGSRALEIPGALAARSIPVPDRRLYLSTGNLLQLISDDGGSPTPIIDPSLGLAQHRPLANGLILAMKIETEEIVVYAPADRSMQTIVRGRSPEMASSGHLVFFRDGSLWAARTKGRMEVDGDPQQMVSGVYSNPAQAFGAVPYALSATGHLAFIPARPPAKRRLVWVSQTGSVLPAFPETSDFEMLRLAPDNTRVAVVEQNGISILDLTRGTRVRLSSEGFLKRRPVWMPDGRTIVYQSQNDVFQQAADGSGPPTPLVAAEYTQFPDAWSPDGTTLLYNEGSATRDLWAFMQGKRVPLLATRANERSGAFHPSGKWFAYVSDDSGRDEVYLQRWPSLGAKTPVSASGGLNPVWSRDGQEIFYREARRMMAVRFDPATGGLSPPQFLFDIGTHLTDDAALLHDVDAAGRFLMIEEESAPPPIEIRVILNWTEELKRKLP